MKENMKTKRLHKLQPIIILLVSIWIHPSFTVECHLPRDCDENPSRSYCEYPNCRACSNSFECQESFPGMYCQTGTCLACTDNAICNFDDKKTKCDSNQRCVGCLSNDDCSHIPGKPLCRSSDQRCVECIDHSDCTSPNTVRCNNGACVGCNNDSQCHANGYMSCSSPNCLTCGLNTECFNIFSIFRPNCAGTTCRCTDDNSCDTPEYSICLEDECQACEEDDQCSKFPQTPYCNPGIGCKECSVDSHCLDPFKPICESGDCVACSFDLECQNGHSKDHCLGDGQCVECLDSAECGVNTPICRANYCSGCENTNECRDLNLPDIIFCDPVDDVCKTCQSDDHCDIELANAACVDEVCTTCSTEDQCKKFGDQYYCSTTLGCIECSSEQQCTDPTPICTAGFCTTCISDEECGRAFSTLRPHCVDSECIGCADSTSCEQFEDFPNCGDDEQCHECTDNIHCNEADRSKCIDYVCTGCQDQSDCSHIIENNVCGNENKCVPLYFTINSLDRPFYPNESIVFFLDLNSSIKEDKTGMVISNLQNADEKGFKIKIDADDIGIDVELTEPNKNQFNSSLLNNITTKNFMNSLTFTFTLDNQLATLSQSISIQIAGECWQDSHCKGDGEECSTDFSCLETYVEPAAKAVKEGMQVATTAAVAAIGPMIVAGADPSIIWALIHIMQMFYYLLFLNVEYPANLQDFLGLFKLGRLEFLPNPFGNNFEKHRIESPTHFQENEFSGLFVQSAGGMIFLIFMTLLLYFGAKVLAIKTCPKKVRRFMRKIVKQFEWSGLLRIWIASFFELMFSSLLQIQNLKTDTSLQSLSSFLGTLVLGANILLPIFLFIYLRNKTTRRSLGKFRAVFEDFDLTDKFKKMYVVTSLLRRIAQVLVVVLFYHIPLLQIISNWAINIIFLILLMIKKPHVRWQLNFLEIFTELSFVVIHSLIMGLAIDAKTQSFRYAERNIMGWVVIYACVGLILMEIVAIGVEQFIVIRDACRARRKKIQNEAKGNQDMMEAKRKSQKKRQLRNQPIELNMKQQKEVQKVVQSQFSRKNAIRRRKERPNRNRDETRNESSMKKKIEIHKKGEQK